MKTLYQVIYSDPAWHYDFSQSKSRNIDINQYKTQVTKEICDFQVPAANDAILYLWATAQSSRMRLK